MTPIRLVLIITLAIKTLTGYAQQDFVVKLKPEVLTITNRTFFIDSVVDARAVTVNIGMAQVGMNNRQVEANFDKPFEAALTDYFKTVLPRHEGQVRIVALVNELRISEKTYKLKERGIADVSITFCRIDSGKLYSLQTFDYQQESGGMDVTAAHQSRLTLALKNCIEKFSKTDTHAPGVVINNTDVEWDSSNKERNILECSERIPGVYAKFTQLRSNSPERKDVYLKPRGILFMAHDNESKLVEPFGVCDGISIYVNTYFYNAVAGKGQFAKVIEEGRILAWYDHYVSATEAGFAGGAFGGIGIAAATSDLDIIGLDLKTGLIKPIKIKSLEQLLAEDPELLSQYRQEKDKGDVVTMMRYVKAFNVRNTL
jgi:hypothetical protein